MVWRERGIFMKHARAHTHTHAHTHTRCVGVHTSVHVRIHVCHNFWNVSLPPRHLRTQTHPLPHSPGAAHRPPPCIRRTKHHAKQTFIFSLLQFLPITRATETDLSPAPRDSSSSHQPGSFRSAQHLRQRLLFVRRRQIPRVCALQWSGACRPRIQDPKKANLPPAITSHKTEREREREREREKERERENCELCHAVNFSRHEELLLFLM